MLLLVLIRAPSKVGKLREELPVEKVQILSKQGVVRLLETEAEFSVGAGFAYLLSEMDVVRFSSGYTLQ